MNHGPDLKISRLVCVFVASSDNTRDVFDQVAPSFGKHWPDCPFPIHVGLNRPAGELPPLFQCVYAPAHRWQTELSHQLRQLPESIEYILLFLDDFLILAPVDTPNVLRLVERAVKDRMSYLRLIPQSRAWLPRMGRKIHSLYHPAELEIIRDGVPYPASLQVALWERAHLTESLQAAEDIWEFEHTRAPGIRHFAVVGHPPIRYVHVVEKGEWEPDAGSLFRNLALPFDPSGRKVRPFRHLLRRRINRVKFAVLGYSIFRLKRWIRKNIN